MKNPEGLANTNSELTEKDGERPLTEEELTILSLEFQRKRAIEALENANDDADTLRKNQYFYKKQIQRTKERDHTQVPEKEFIIWEKDFHHTWEHMNKEITISGKGNTIADQAEIMRKMIPSWKNEKDLEETIEAQAGRFYQKRNDELIDAIRKSEKSESEKEQDLDYVNDFPRLVFQHIDYRYQFSERDMDKDYEMLDRLRTKSHNEVIKQLNGLNKLAKKYGTTAYTPRDFWTSEYNRQTSAMSEKMSYDRHVVEAYYTNAFRRDVERTMSGR